MRIRNMADSNFSERIFGVQFVNGESVEHFNQNQIDKLRALGRFEFEIIDERCPNCEKLEKEIVELKKQLRKK